MHTTKIIHTVSCHAAGEIGDVIVAGILLAILLACPLTSHNSPAKETGNDRRRGRYRNHS